MKLSARIAFLSLLYGTSCIAAADQAFGQSRIYGPVTNIESPNSFIMYQQPSGPANPTARAGVADVRGDYAMAIGAAATAHAFEAIAIGHESEARQTPNAPTDQVGEAGRAIAIGARAKAYDTGIAIGLTSVAGAGSEAGVLDYRPSAIAIGQNTFARTTESIAIGKFATVTEEKALGQNADRSIAIGRSATITGSQNSVAIGPDVAVFANSPNSIALGFRASVVGNAEGGIAIGDNASVVGGTSTIAIGTVSMAENESIAIGSFARALGNRSMALGQGSKAEGLNSVALGFEAFARADSSTAIGRFATAQHLSSTALGFGAVTTRNSQVVIGTSLETVTVPNVAGSGNQFLFATADGTLNRYTGATTIDSDLLISGSQAIGGNLTVGGDVVFNNYKNTNPGSGTTFLSTDANGKVALAAIPNGTTFCTLVGANSSCYGPNAEAKGAFDTAIGANSRADAALGSTALGAETNASGNGSTAIGVLAKSQGEGSLAVGFAANSTAEDGIAIGSNALANGFNAFAFGTGAVANGRNVTAIGFGARAEGFNTNSLALGTGSLASGTDVTALGAGATATGVRATAIGAGAITTRNNQVVIGTSLETVTAPSVAGIGNQFLFATADGTLNRYTGATTIDSDLLISGSQAIGGNLTVGGDVVFNNYKNTNPGSGTTFLSTDANGKVALAAIPNGTTFCTLVGANSSCYGPNAEAKGAFDTAIGANSRADAALGSTALGAETNASGNGSTAIGVLAKSQGEGSLAVGFAANSTAEDGIAIGSNALANGFNAFAFGTGAVANGRNVTAIGFGARAEGFNTNSLALGTGSLASGTDVTALGAGATATGVRATAIGAGAITTRNNQVVIGTQQDDVTMPGLSGSGTDLVAANNDGTLQRSSVSLQQVDQAVNTTIPKLESAVSGLGQAVESVGAIASAMSAVPQVSLMEDEPMRCGVGTGGYGSEYAISAGCAVRIADRLHLNGALAYAPSVNYQYGSTPSVAGRLGFSFPLGRIAKPSSKPTAEASKELSNVQGTIQKIQAEVKSRDNQIAILKTQLDKLLKAQHSETSTPSSKATTELIATFMSRIEQLENRLAEQELISQRAMEQLKSLVGSAPLGMGAISKVNR